MQPSMGSDMNTEQLYTRRDLMAKHRVCSDTITRWIRERRLPPPDLQPSRKTQQWRHSTLLRVGMV